MLSESTNEVLRKLHEILKNEKIKVTLTQSGKAGLISGLCTVAGGLLGGKKGITIGGLTGTLINHFVTQDFSSLVHVIKYELNDEQKTTLAELVKEAMQIANSSSVVDTVMTYLRNLGYQPILATQ